eukprot:CAMPEP_0119125258 /NCGR_PEP_ID=MMETSP1310-20130426/4602_1 /TAXON_ID=464262 /ORGANISM="Genus nov. species nov., Strain RCC2339" /LENGTH=616 /DNA_ID=CAMNT_0007115309 /DNA_START=165 /DNA_END=2012 /DNA_ORIENTATION=-
MADDGFLIQVDDMFSTPSDPTMGHNNQSTINPDPFAGLPFEEFEQLNVSPPRGEDDEDEYDMFPSNASAASTVQGDTIIIQEPSGAQPSYWESQEMSDPSMRSYSMFPGRPRSPSPPGEGIEVEGHTNSKLFAEAKSVTTAEPRAAKLDNGLPGESPFLQGAYGTSAFVSDRNLQAMYSQSQGGSSHDADQIQLLRLILTDPDFLILHHLSDALPPQDGPVTARMLLVLMHANKFLIPPIVSIVQREISQCSFPSSMFRTDSLSSHLFTSFTFIMGSNYLQNLVPLVSKIIDRAEDLEVDPSRNLNPEAILENQKRLLYHGSFLLDALLGNMKDCPPEFSFVAQIMQIEILSKFPDRPQYKHQVVASFIFTRYICTALVRPEDFNLYNPIKIVPGMTTATSACPRVKPKARRTLAFLSKLLHNAVLGTKCQEPYLRFMDMFIEDYSPRIREFCGRLASPSHPYEPPPLASKVYINGSAMRHVQYSLTDCLDKLQESLSAIPGKGEQLSMNLTGVLDRLKQYDVSNLKFENVQKKKKRDKQMSVAKNLGDRKTAIAGAGAGAVAGGVVGTLIAPGIGTVVGAAVGGAVCGTSVHQIGHNQKVKREKQIFQEEMAGVW